MGESIVAGPVFTSDSSQVALQVRVQVRSDAQAVVQVRDRLLFWDMGAAAPLEGAVALPPGTRLLGPTANGIGWIAGTDPKAADHFVFDADTIRWVRESCKLAGRSLTVAEWRRYVGSERPYAPSCKLP